MGHMVDQSMSSLARANHYFSYLFPSLFLGLTQLVACE